MHQARAILLVGLVGCAPSTEINPTVTRLTADPLAFDFGILELGEEVSETVALHAEGGEVFVEHVTAYGIGLTLSDGLEGAFIDEGLPATIDFTIQPGDYGLYEAWFVVDSDATMGADITIEMFAEVPAPWE